MLDSQRKIRRIIPEQRLLQLLIEERQLTGGFAPVGRYKFNVLDPSVGTPVHSQIQLPRASELVRPAHISAGAAGQHHGKVLAYCELEATQQRPECRRHSPSATCQQFCSGWSAIKPDCETPGAAPASPCFLRLDRSGPGMDLCMSPIRLPSRHQLLFHPDPPAQYAGFGWR